MNTSSKSNTLVSLYNSTFDKVSSQSLPLDTILERIKNGSFKIPVEKLRSLSKEEYKKQKKNVLKSFTTSGTFKTRKVGEEDLYNGFIILDVDGLEDLQTTKKLKKQISKLKFVYSIFISPSNVGLKVIVKTENTDPTKHLLYFEALKRIFEIKFPVDIDRSGKDTCRLCFVSYDPELYLNNESSVFQLEYSKPEYKLTKIEDPGLIFEHILMITNKRAQFVEGEKHNYTVLCSTFCVHFGLSESTAIDMIMSEFGSQMKDPEHHSKTIEDIYKRYRSKSGTKVLEKWMKIEGSKKSVSKAEISKETIVEDDDSDEFNPSLFLIDCFTLIDEAEDLQAKDKALTEIARMLLEVKGTFMQDALQEKLCEHKKIQKGWLKQKIREEKPNVIPEEHTFRAPLDFLEQMEEKGYAEVMSKQDGYDIGYYFAASNGYFDKKSTFVIEPLYHIYSAIDNKRLIKIKNRKEESIIDLPSRALVSHSLLYERLVDEGANFWYGTPKQLMKIIVEIGESFPVCQEVLTLGWQKDAWAFSNGMFNGKFNPVDSNGIVEHKEKKYFLPAYSEIANKTDVDEDNDPYEIDRFYAYRPSDLSTEEIFQLMHNAYCQNNNGMMGIAYVVATIFRDYIYKTLKFFPHLFLYGKSQAGKSQLLWTISNIFTDNLQPFNLNNGTKVSFTRRLAITRNCVTAFDEYTNHIDMDFFQVLKSAYDGIGREKGLATKNNRTTTSKVKSGLVIAGQYLPTLDDNALYNRSIVLTFNKDNKRKKETIDAHRKLKTVEGKGLSNVVTDMLQYREDIENNYNQMSDNIFSEIKSEMPAENIEDRIVKNFVCLLTPIKILQDKIKLPFTYDELKDHCKEMIEEQCSLLSNTEGQNIFWDIISLLVRMKKLKREQDYIIDDRKYIKLLNKGQQMTKTFDREREILMIRFSHFHLMYSEQARKSGLEVIDQNSLMGYFKSLKSFVGVIKTIRFGGTNSSALAFYHDELTVDLDIEIQDEGKNEAPTQAINDKVSGGSIENQELTEKPDDTPF